MLEIFVILLAALAGVISQTILGFGLSLFLIPALLVYLSPSVSVTITLLLGSVVCLMILYSERRTSEASRPIVLRLFLAAIPGLLLGSYIVTRIDKAWLQIIVGVLIIISIVVQEQVFPKPSKPLRISPVMSLSGFVAGVLNACAAQAPPPLLVWMRAHVTTPNQVRHNLAAVMVLMNIGSIITIHFLQPKSFSSAGVIVFAYLLPVSLVGNALGRMLTRRINTKQFHQLIFIAIVTAGIFSVILGTYNLR
jgi:hypothetical protein